jgi:hypothetical protein
LYGDTPKRIDNERRKIVKSRKSFIVSTIVLLLALVAGVQAADGLYAQSFLSGATLNVVDPGAALGLPDGADATVGLDGLWGGLMLDMGQDVCQPLYVYAPMDSLGTVSVHPCGTDDDPCPENDYGGIGFLSDEDASSYYDGDNDRWVMYFSDATPGSQSDYTGAIRTVAIDNIGYEETPISVDAVEASPCGPVPEFGGFLPPIAGDALNSAKAGRAVPVNFGLGGDFGLDILESTSVQVACDSETVSVSVVPTVSAGASGLTYDPETDLYTYVWKTEKSWSGTCRQLSLMIGDNTYTADFQFK